MIEDIETEEDKELLRLYAVGLRAKAKQAMAQHVADAPGVYSPFSTLFVLTAEEAAFLGVMDKQGDPS